MGKRATTMKKFAQLKKEENILKKEKSEFKAMHFIMPDTSSMNVSQCKLREKYEFKLR
jgi:hypothetical protein